MKTISVARDFTVHPGPRRRAQGEFSGEAFREELLAPTLEKHAGKVAVSLDGTRGFGSSFLDEAFGGLVRDHGFSADDLHKRLVILSPEDETYLIEAWEAIDQAKLVQPRRA